MIINAIPTIYSAFYSAIVRACGNLQVVANRAFLLDGSESIISGSEVAFGASEVGKGFVLSAEGGLLRVTYLNSLPQVIPTAMVVSFRDSSTMTNTPLIRFDFSEALESPAWGLWTFEFNITFTS